MENRKIRVVVVEDENLIARNIAKHIEAENENFTVVGIYSNGEDALEAIKKQPPDVVFTDISMPVMTGLELAREIHNSMDHVKCVIITGFAEFSYAREAMHYGVKEYLLKPLDTEELHKILKNLELSTIDLDEERRTDREEAALSPEEIVTLVKDYIQKNYSGDLDLNTIAANLGFSSSYLTKVFNKCEHITPSRYIRHYRMGIAKKLLADPGLSIQQVASGVGYSDPFHFSKSFKQTVGLTPSEYKASL